MFSRLAVLLLLCGCVLLAPAQEARTTFTTTVNQDVGGQYLVRFPAGYDADTTRTWPTILFLHGAGERGDDLDLVKVHGPPKIAEQQADFPFLVIAPQAPAGSWWDRLMLVGVIEDALANYRIDPDRLYLTGLSMGGFGSWELAAYHPEYFAAVAPICGGGWRRLGCMAKDLPIWAFHGARDRVVPLNGSIDLVNEHQRCGGTSELTIYPDAGHDSWTETYNNPALYDWFLSHRRGAE